MTLTFLNCKQVDLAYKAIDAGTEVALHLEQWFEETEVHQLGLPLEVLIIVPLNNWVLQLTDPICVAEYFQYPIFDISLFSVIIVGEHGVSGWIREHGREPFDGVDVDHALHIEEIDGDLNGVALRHLVDGLNVRPINQLLHLLPVHELGCVRTFKLL